MPKLIDGLSKDAIDDLAEIAMQLSRNADTRKPFLNAIKKIDPNRRFPSQEVDDLRAEMQEKLEADREARKLEDERKQIDARLNAQRSSLIGKGYTDDQLKEVEEVMTKYGITDYEAGADLYQARKPAAAPGAGPSATWDMPAMGNTSLADLIADPVKHSRNEAYNVITELKRGRAA